MSEKELTIEQTHAKERAYYLGKSETVPESVNSELGGKTIKEAKAIHQKNVEKDHAELLKRSAPYMKDPSVLADIETAEPETGGVGTSPEGSKSGKKK